MNIVAIVGSVREQSYNRKLARCMQERYRNRFALDILNIGDLPHYDQDRENDPPAAVSAFKRKVAEADAVMWVTPEYNYSIPGAMKNAIDWLSRVDKPLVGKPSWILGASMGALGTIRAQLHLRDILISPGVSSPVMTGNEVYIGAVHEKIDENGNLTHQPTVAFLDTVVDNFLRWAQEQKRLMRV